MPSNSSLNTNFDSSILVFPFSFPIQTLKYEYTNKKLRMKYHIKVGDVVKYADVDDGIKIVPSELTSIPTKIKEMWDEADEKKISMKEIVEKVKKVRSQVYNEEYGA